LSAKAYGALDRFLHRLALGAGPLAEMSFDIDQRMAKADPASARDGRHVFVSGLARAGTTVLMRRFHATGAFRSLTYRDMPFVLAPNLWKKLTASSRRDIARAQRAHGDSLEVDADSPESFEEVFWRVMDGESYLGADRLGAHDPDDAVVERFVGYVAAVLASDDAGRTRYLSKNNNNVLRLPAIRRAFPRAHLLIPFREPVAHARSLMAQHRQFSALHATDRFARSYMTWLGHHEFGADHRPMALDPSPAGAPSDPDTLDYWLERWRSVYARLERDAPAGALFVCYEDLCADAGVWARLAAATGAEGETAFYEPLSSRPAATTDGADPGLLGRVRTLYDALRERAAA
jgi:hypothetical protein